MVNIDDVNTYHCKVVMLGDQAVGKTCLAFRYTKDAFFQTHTSTLGGKAACSCHVILTLFFTRISYQKRYSVCLVTHTLSEKVTIHLACLMFIRSKNQSILKTKTRQRLFKIFLVVKLRYFRPVWVEKPFQMDLF